MRNNYIAPPGTDPALIDGRSGKLRRVSKQLQKAIAAIENGSCRSVKAASERIGVSYTYLCEALKKPHVQAFIAQKRRQNVATASLRASARVAELLDGQSEHVAADMAKWALGVQGIKPEDTARIAVNVDVRAGYVIDLSRNSSDINEIAHEPSVQIEHRVGPAIDALPERQPLRRVLEGPPAPSFPAPAPRPGQQASDERRDKLEREFGEASRALPRQGGKR